MPDTPPLRLTCADYARVMPLATGEVTMEGGELSLVLGRQGSWPDRADMLRRALRDPGVQGGEASMGVHLARMDRGDRSFVALPVFVLRNFTARDLYVRKGASFRTAAELAGKRIGMYSWTASGSIWYRHFLAYAGVDVPSVQWWIGDIDQPSAGERDPSLPPFAQVPARGRSIAQMLLDGELDAIYSPPRPRDYHPVQGPIVRLYPDSREVERTYYRDTGVFPPQHLVVLRREVWEADRSLARRVTDAFIRCEQHFRTAVRSFPYVSPWLDQDLEDAEALMGGDPYGHGIDANRTVMEQFCEQGHRLGLTQRRIGVDEYFAEFLAS